VIGGGGGGSVSYPALVNLLLPVILRGGLLGGSTSAGWLPNRKPSRLVP
jgi:hypothetical protein